MNSIKTTPFTEYVAVLKSESTDLQFDIIVTSQSSLGDYCQGLLEKLFSLTYSNYASFLAYQIKPLQSPMVWLEELEHFLCSNEELFIEKKVVHRYNKIHHCIELKRTLLKKRLVQPAKTNLPKRYINAESEERYFSFYEIKKSIDKLEDNEKILVLTKEKHEYRQSNIEFINQKLPLFDKQCSKEIQQIYEMQSIKKTIEKSQPSPSMFLESGIPKLQFHCNVNQFVDVFYQFTRELTIEGKPFVEGNINDVVAMIVNSFIDKEGKELSPYSVKTILQPSRGDKRPNSDKRIDISKML